MFDSLKAIYSQCALIFRFVRDVFPLVESELSFWKRYATERIGGELQTQALASIRDKKFHCLGGSIYCLYDGANPAAFVRLIVALQTISDYLDNLCDRVGTGNEVAFRQLHLAMTDALTPNTPIQDYYRYYEFQDDGGYLEELVRTCQLQIATLPGYSSVQSDALHLASLYSDLQVYKHLHTSIRELKMLDWIGLHVSAYPRVSDWEFAAATGSTLGMFVLCAAAHKREITPQEAAAISRAYFPWICGLHILLDYFIDSVEDRIHGDLNFVSYYQSPDETVSRLSVFFQQALAQSRTLDNQLFTETIVFGLLALYLSDSKANLPEIRPLSKQLLDSAPPQVRIIYWICRVLRLIKNF